jgi:hypothetical protein
LGSAGAPDGSAEPVGAPEAQSAEATPAGTELPAAPPPQTGSAPALEGDWLASVCPYLTSEDGTYRSAAPDDGHRCTAQDPAATLPLAFQERFCLTDRHPRCEMYKFAQETDASGAIPVAKVPPTDPPTPRARSGPGGSGRPAWLAAVGIGGAVVFIVVLALVMGSCVGGGGGTDVDGQASAEPQATEQAAATSEPTPEPTSEPDPTPTPDPEATPDEAGTAAELVIIYEIQPDEALRKVAETFGISRNRIRRANPDLEALTPAELPGTFIEIPITGDMTLEEAEALPGYQGIAP